MIFGGDDYDVYLGKLNASKYDSESIWNEYGSYGNSYSSTSIWNEYSSYGSDYSSYSPFNEYATYPPVIVDAQGNFYGYFTVNEYKSKRAEFNLVLIIRISTCRYPGPEVRISPSVLQGHTEVPRDGCHRQ